MSRDDAEAAIAGTFGSLWSAYLPADLLARLLDIASQDPVICAVKVCCTRYAVENPQDRLTLDMDVRTDTGKCLRTNVLEFKSNRQDPTPPDSLLSLGLRPMKLSKFLWATLWR